MPESNDKTDTAAIAAARQYHRAVQAAERRASLSRQATAAKGRPRESLRAHCRRLNVPYTTVSRHCQALKSTGRLTLSERGIGRPRALTDADDATLVAYIVELEWAGVRVSKQMVVARANELRSLRSPGAGRLNRGWYARWRLDHDDALRAAAANIAQSSRVMEGWDPQGTALLQGCEASAGPLLRVTNASSAAPRRWVRPCGVAVALPDTHTDRQSRHPRTVKH